MTFIKGEKLFKAHVDTNFTNGDICIEITEGEIIQLGAVQMKIAHTGWGGMRIVDKVYLDNLTAKGWRKTPTDALRALRTTHADSIEHTKKQIAKLERYVAAIDAKLAYA